MDKFSTNKIYENITKKSYNEISNWDLKRQYLWNTTKFFLNKCVKINDDFKILDIGCGGGRNLTYSKKIGFKSENLYGVDYSKTQINTILEKGFNGKVSKIQNLEKDYKEEFFDLLICEASFHHILNIESQKDSLKSIKKILKNDGVGIISIWLPDKEFIEKNIKKKKFEFVDKSILKVSYTDLDQNKIFDRYYYFFKKKEILDLFKTEFEIINSNQDKGNFYIEFKKQQL